MSPSWTSDQVLALAPDASVARAARDLAAPRRWLTFASNGQAIWGEHQGSAREPYRVAIDLNGPAFKCSCPSRKVPCKHALGLLLLHGAQPGGEFAPPEWVASWLAQRQTRVERPSTQPADPERSARDQAQRAERREARIDAGVADLDRWLQDFARTGFAEMASRPWSTYEQMSARLVDAQAAGLARFVRDIGALPHTHANWPERMLINLGRLTLLVEAWRQREVLEPELQAEVRSLVGINESRESVLARAGVPDVWHVVGRRLLEGERMTVQRTWLWGTSSRRWALILEFSAGGQPLDRTLLPGSSFEAELCFYDGSVPVRALLKSEAKRALHVWPLPGETIAALATRYATWLGRNPWLERIPAVLGEVIPMRTEDGTWQLVDAEQHSVPMGADQAWHVLAMSGGEPLQVAGEWDGYRFWPLSINADEHLIALRESHAA